MKKHYFSYHLLAQPIYFQFLFRKIKDILYESVMDIIVKANLKLFEKEGDAMCKALEELMKDELEAQKKIGAVQGENRVNQLNQKLISLGRTDDMVKSVSDKLYQQKLFKEFNL